MPLRPAGVVHAKRRLAARERDLPHRHAQARRAKHVHLGRVGKRAREIVGRERERSLSSRSHRPNLDAEERPGRQWGGSAPKKRRATHGGALTLPVVGHTTSCGTPRSLRRYDPDQVPRDCLNSEPQITRSRRVPLAVMPQCSWRARRDQNGIEDGRAPSGKPAADRRRSIIEGVAPSACIRENPRPPLLSFSRIRGPEVRRIGLPTSLRRRATDPPRPSGHVRAGGRIRRDTPARPDRWDTRSMLCTMAPMSLGIA